MVAKPIVNLPDATPDAARLDLDPISLPICLEFGPVLKLLARGRIHRRQARRVADSIQRSQSKYGGQAGAHFRRSVADNAHAEQNRFIV